MKKISILAAVTFLMIILASCAPSVPSAISISDLPDLYSTDALSEESLDAITNQTHIVPNYEAYGNPETADQAPKGRNFVMVGKLGKPYTFNGKNVLVDFWENEENLYTLYVDELAHSVIYAVQNYAGEIVEVNGSFRGFSEVTNAPLVQVSGVYAGKSWFNGNIMTFSADDKMIYVEGTKSPEPASSMPKETKPGQTVEPTATPEPTEEPTPEPEEDAVPEIDWDKLAEDFKADTAVSDQPFYKDVYVSCDGDTITISAVVAADTDDDTVLEYADTLVRRLGALANQQNSAYAAPGFESFGGLYDYYNVMIGIAPQGSEGDQKSWYIYDAIAKGVQTKHKLKITRK